jgi:hypothetical protein
MPAKIFLALLLTFCATLSGKSGQEVGYVDLTTAVVGQRIHEPTTGSGSGMGIGSSVRALPDILQPLRISIVSLESTKYKVNDDVVYEIKVENTGHEQIMIPWDPNLSHMEPEGAATEYSYRIASIALRLSHAGKRFESLGSNLLFGTTGVPGSFIKIAPGEWVRVRAKARLSASLQPDDTQESECSVSAKVVWTISNAHVSRRADGYHEDVTSEGPETVSVNAESFELVTPGQNNCPLSGKIVPAQDISGLPLIDALLLFAQREHIPMSIEYIDEQALTENVSVHTKDTTVAGLLSLILPPSGYTWSERYGVIDVTHVGAPIGRANLLDHVIPTFDIPRSSLDEFSFELEMALKHDLNPEAGGFGGDYISIGPPVFVGPFHLREASVREILSRAARQEGLAAWVVTVPPEGLSQASSHSLWKMLPYTQPASRYSSLLLQALGQVGHAQDGDSQRHPDAPR